MKVDKKDYLQLLEIANQSENGLARINLHTPESKKVQLMIIAIKGGIKYPPISDQAHGWIVFSVIKGSLIINTYEATKNVIKKTGSTYLKQGDVIKIRRDIYRETICSDNNGSIYMEIIEGKFDLSKRKTLIN